MSDVQKDITTGKSLEEASALRLIMTTGIRPGSDTDTQAKVKAYGATTLHGSHVVQEGGGVRLKFTGKKGVNLDIPVTDATVAKDLLARKKNAGDSGRLFQTDSSKLLDYTHSQDGGKFKTKDFRTLMGTRTAVVEMANLGWHPLTKTDYVKAVKTVARKVAEKLGNTPVVALQSYIHPGVFGIWRINSGANA
jgi:DNA topoisomerase-1